MMNKIELTDKEMIIVWSVVTWFQVSQLATFKLVKKLYPDLVDKQYRYDKQIEDRIIAAGKSLEKMRQEEAENDRS